jgi:DNA-binding CsgD family transcriptional regulator
MADRNMLIAGRPIASSDPLVPNEFRALVGIGSGRTMGEIGEELSVARGTVRTHLRRAYAKLGAHGGTHAVAIAMAAGILKGEHITLGRASIAEIRSANFARLDSDRYNVVIGTSIRLSVAELQLAERSDARGGSWWQLSGWLREEYPSLEHIQQATLTRVTLPERFCPTGMPVRIRTTKSDDEYGVGVYLTLRWPKEDND